MELQRASQSPVVRTVGAHLRHALCQPLARWLGREPSIIINVPPLDREMVSAIRLIAPQYSWLRADERSRVFWEREQNSSCWAEDAALAPILSVMPSPKRVLELGPGLGRSAVFFARRYFHTARFDLFDATGHDTKYELLGRRYHDSFCGNLSVLKRCLDHNRVYDYRLIDANESAGRIPTPAEPYDFIYSFYSVGYHWALDHWLDELMAVAHDGTLCAFIVPSQFRPSPRLASMPHVLLQAAPRLQPVPWTTTFMFVFTPKPQSWFSS